MIADLKPYAQYRESGLAWLDRVPSHWKTRRSKYLFREVDQRSVSGAETRLSMSQRHGLIPSSQIEERRLVAASNVGGKLCEPGDLVLNRLKAHLGVLALSPTHGLVSPDYTVLRPIGAANRRYFCAVYRSPYCGQELRQRAKGIVEGFWRLYTDDFYDIRVPLPPAAEQAAIVRFLDWANLRLEGAIRAKRKVIALLSEQRQAIIHRAVTRGIDASVQFKPSDIPWLGDVPAHWEVVALKRIAWFKSGAGFPVEEQGQESLEFPFLKVSDMTKPGNEKWIESANNTTARETAERLGAFIFPEHSIIFPKVGGAMLTNKRRLLRRPSCIDNNIMGCVVWRADLDFVFVFLEQLDLGRLSKPGPVPAIGEGEVREIRVCVPPKDEQVRIVRNIADATRPLITTISRLEREIELLREYRTRLVADVVTGKLDVREAAARLPVEVAPDIVEHDTDLSDDTEAADEKAVV